jgi:hypothetical protein
LLQVALAQVFLEQVEVDLEGGQRLACLIVQGAREAPAFVLLDLDQLTGELLQLLVVSPEFFSCACALVDLVLDTLVCDRSLGDAPDALLFEQAAVREVCPGRRIVAAQGAFQPSALCSIHPPVPSSGDCDARTGNTRR